MHRKIFKNFIKKLSIFGKKRKEFQHQIFFGENYCFNIKKIGRIWNYLREL